MVGAVHSPEPPCYAGHMSLTAPCSRLSLSALGLATNGHLVQVPRVPVGRTQEQARAQIPLFERWLDLAYAQVALDVLRTTWPPEITTLALERRERFNGNDRVRGVSAVNYALVPGAEDAKPEIHRAIDEWLVNTLSPVFSKGGPGWVAWFDAHLEARALEGPAQVPTLEDLWTDQERALLAALNLEEATPLAPTAEVGPSPRPRL